MARRPNYSYEKNARARAKAAKREAKRQQKAAARAEKKQQEASDDDAGERVENATTDVDRAPDDGA